MFYYKRHIGDYSKKAGRLTMLQHGAYTLLLDACYDREIFPTLEQAIEWLWASNDADVEAITFVLNRFFTLEADGRYIQSRISDELDDYHAKGATNKRIAIEREAKRREKEAERVRLDTERTRFVHEPPPNQEPLTNNHKPITNITTIAKTPTQQIPSPVGVCVELWSDYMALRKTKKSAMTKTALSGLERECNKAGLSLEAGIRVCCERGWASLKAEWLDDKKLTVHQQQMQAFARGIGIGRTQEVPHYEHEAIQIFDNTQLEDNSHEQF